MEELVVDVEGFLHTDDYAIEGWWVEPYRGR
jgi:hypothetical protein